MRSTHNPSLDNIDRTANGRRNKTSQEGRSEVRGQIIVHSEALHADALEDVVRGQLAGGHEDGSGGVGPYAAEETREAFGARHALDAVEGVFVVSPLRGWEACI